MNSAAVRQQAPEYVVEQSQISICKYCRKQIVWQTSYRTGSKYATELKELGTADPTLPFVYPQLVTSRTWFHQCDRKAAQQLPLIPQPPVVAAVYTPLGKSRAARVRAMREFVLAASEPQLLTALKTIFNRQTRTEQAHDATSDLNNIGFGGSDAEICSNICKAAMKFGSLRGKQVDLIRKKMKKYARQLVEALEAGEWKI